MAKRPKIVFDILTIFPEMFECYFNASILGKAQEAGHIKINVHNLRDWAEGKHKVTDDMAYGGISGMVMKVEPIYYAVNSIKSKIKNQKSKVILLSAKGKTLNQKKVRQLGKLDRIILIAGHYKGVDERVAKYIADEELSVGEYVVTGGEVPTMLVVDAVSRMVSGVIGKDESKKGESFSHGVKYEHGVYTRPAEFYPKKGKAWKVPDILLSGHHAEIEKWRTKSRKKA
ncbi:MAG: tRNA (guanosine(37)-N1)-methyltransferase TrmD [Candidatus Spechtbacteria bacterium RIFCSPLOWO2_02_FULL_38_8]|uniref:tRNA (guanine-N(1)-)-methyltransferase n=1 Tax=Candidatus Spechtbacteria bacterium RIFCSPLOWO2_02_FULL_38_8 TaxID=1802164 RepID=A0A1G2HKL0_9BACT|nr:MAG: tRNA (guanosine(37)-N1)-methyltransferase TrmD [Candidatus Spechtbacteria bacterium RIFCSPLOWO2_02_FULL_38_8]